MPSALNYLGIAAVASFAVNKLAPQYSIGIILTTLILFTAIIVGKVGWNAIIYPRFFSPLRDLPEPPNGDFIMGQTWRILREESGMPARDWVETVKNDGLIRYSVWMNERVLVTSPKVLKELLMTKSYEFVKPSQIRHGLARILGMGILFAEGDEHRIQRKNLLPAFAFRHVKDLYPIFWDKSRALVEALVVETKKNASQSEKPAAASDSEQSATTEADKHAPGAIEAGGWVSRATLDIIGVTGMDRDFNALKDPTNELTQQYRRVLNPSRTARVLGLAGMFLPRWIIQNLPVKHNQNIWAAADYIKATCRDLIAKKRQAMAEEKTSKSDIISVALQSGLFQDEELVNQMMTFLVAGHETTASAMNWALYLLCKHPEVQTKLRDAIRAKIPSLDREVTPADIDGCHYLNAFCAETLRLWPPVSMTMRVAAADTSLNGHFIPRGTLIIICPWAVNASTHAWGADAAEFRPERWLDAEGRANNSGGADSAYSFLTFLHGPRACIGQRFAEAEFACIVAAWVGKFETTFEQGSPLATKFPEIKGGVTSRPKAGVWVHLKEVEGW